MISVIKYKPVATFYYRGNHSHPVRRTILVIKSTPTYLCGYELREGSTTRKLRKAPVKSFTKKKIATLSDLGARKHRKPGPNVTSLKRKNLLELITEGI